MAMVVAKKGGDEDYTIKPEAATPAVDTSNWPLLLKNYDKREYTRRWLALEGEDEREQWADIYAQFLSALDTLLQFQMDALH